MGLCSQSAENQVATRNSEIWWEPCRLSQSVLAQPPARTGLAVSSVVAKALPVAVSVGTEAVRVVGLLVIVAVAAKLPIVLAVTQTLLEVVHAPASIANLIGWIIPEALLVPLAVGTEVAPASGLLVIAAVAAILAIVLAVPQTLLEVTDVSASIVPVVPVVLLFVGCKVPKALSVAVLVGTEVVRIGGLPVIAPVDFAALLKLVIASILRCDPTLRATFAELPAAPRPRS